MRRRPPIERRLTQWLAPLVALWCLASAAQSLRIAAGREVDPVARLDSELRALAANLPRRGVVGYVEPDTERGTMDSLRMRHVAQYALAPRVVVYDVRPEFLIVPHGARREDEDPRLKGFVRVATSRSGHSVLRRLAP